MPGHEEALATSARIAEMVEPNYESLGLGSAASPRFNRPANKTPEDYLRELCEQGLQDRYGDDPAAEARGPAGPRAGHHQPDGVRLLLPDRLGLRPLRPRAGNPGLGPRLGLRRAWSATCSSSATSARSSTTCCSSGSSTPIVPRRPISTSTSARSGDTR